MALQRDKIIANAERLAAKGKIDLAIREFQKLLKDSPNDIKILNRLGDLYHRLHRHKEAIEAFFKIADIFAKDGFNYKAIAILRKINKIDPSLLEVYEQLAHLYQQENMMVEAANQYQSLASYYLNNGQEKEALEAYKKMVELDPENIAYRGKLAELLQKTGANEEALEEYLHIGNIFSQKGHYEEAIRVYKQAITLDPGNLKLAKHLADVLTSMGKEAEAIGILQDAFDVNPGDIEVVRLLVKAYTLQNNLSKAMQVVQEALRQDPDNLQLFEIKSAIQVKSGDFNGAAKTASAAADFVNTPEGYEKVLNLCKAILKKDPNNTLILAKMVEIYEKLKQETYVLSTLSQLVDAHIHQKNYGEAEKVLNRLIDLEPQNFQHQDKLSYIHKLQGEQAEKVPVPEAPKELEEIPTEEITLEEFDELPELEIPVVEDQEAAPPVQEEVAEIPEDLENQIQEWFLEVDVFLKYGLTDRALGHLQEIIYKAPDYIPAYRKLLSIYEQEKRMEEYRDVANHLYNLFLTKGMREEAETLKEQCLIHHITLEEQPIASEEAVEEPAPEVVEKTEEVPPELPEEAPALTAEAEELVDLDIPLEPEMEAPEERPVETEPPEIPLEPEAATLSLDQEREEILETFTKDMGELLEEEKAPKEPVQEKLEKTQPIVQEEQIKPKIPKPKPKKAPEININDILQGVTKPKVKKKKAKPKMPDVSSLVAEITPSIKKKKPKPITPEPVVEEMKEEVKITEPAPEDLGELDFYLEQELADEAQKKLEELQIRFPNHPELESRQKQLQALYDRVKEAAVPQPEMADGEALFSDEEEFFDLAQELEKEIASVEDELAAEIPEEAEPNLEEIFEQFKKGVEQKLSSEDYETHYNLGIAYKEMGLIDEAISEFQIAAKDPHHLIECCTMLGICFLEKGMPQLAEKWYQKGLEHPEITEEEQLGVMYDLGNLYLQIGDTEKAYKTFLDIYAIHASYRDVKEKIEELEKLQTIM